MLQFLVSNGTLYILAEDPSGLVWQICILVYAELKIHGYRLRVTPVVASTSILLLSSEKHRKEQNIQSQRQVS